MASYKHSAPRSLRLRLLVLLLVPLFSLGALWAFAAYLTTRDALEKNQASTTFQKVGDPGVTLALKLARERAASAKLLSTHGHRGRAETTTARGGTDAEQSRFRRSALSPEVQRTMSATTRQRFGALLTRLDGLPGVRAQIDAGTVDAMGAIDGYDAAIDAILRLFNSVVLINDPDVYRQGTAIISVSTANEFMLREDAVMSVALAGPRHRLTGPEFAVFARSASNGRYLFDTGLADLRPNLRAPFERIATSPEYTRLRTIEDSIVAGGTRTSLAPKAAPWHSAVTPLMATWPQAAGGATARLTADVKPIGDRIMYKLYVAAGLGAVVVVLSVVISLLYGRSLARELVGLQRAALDLADERLPRLVRRLRAGEKVDVDAEAPPIRVGKSREVANVADALTALQRTAVESAVGEAHVRQGINQVFLNVAWRSQSLLHRQLSMLDTMEREASDPDALEGLFALDHLTTRMRRHAEGLVILAGSAPARGWHNPVAVRDVLRAAIAEVEDYTRVVVETASPAALEGGIVADATHLLAELIENATAFSPPPVPVNIRGGLTSTGYAVEIEDRGIGMNEAELADANLRLASPPEFDLADSDRLGLFIVGRLAERHGIDVKLTASPYGGVRAIVLIPLDYLAGDTGTEVDETWSGAEPERRPAAWRSSSEPAGGAVGQAAIPGPVAGGPVAGGPVPSRPVVDGRPATGPVRSADPATPRTPGLFVPAEDRDRTDDDAPELPRRVRQASLAPQLRIDTPGAEPAGAGPATTRPPEETRSLMSALQQGWQRGREEEDPDE